MERTELAKSEPNRCAKAANLSINLMFSYLDAIKLPFQSVKADDLADRYAAGYDLCREPEFRRSFTLSNNGRASWR